MKVVHFPGIWVKQFHTDQQSEIPLQFVKKVPKPYIQKFDIFEKTGLMFLKVNDPTRMKKPKLSD